jgi:PAS domain S-box-containing protein
LPRVDLGIRPEEGLVGWIIRNRTAIIIDDSRIDDRWVANSESPELRSIIGVPLIANDEVIGVLTLFHHDPGAFTEKQLELVSAAAMQVASAISNAQLYLLIRDQAERLGNMLRVEHIETAKSKAILESIADGVLVADANGIVVLANLSASQILEIPRNKLSGKSVNELLGLYSAVGENWIQRVDKWSRSTREDAEAQFLAERLSIEDKFVSVRLSPVFARGQFFGTVSIFRDVTQAVEVDRMKSEFVSTVSHELRTPMTSVKGYAELMLMGATGSISDEQKRYLEVISSNADRMSELVNDLLDISRIESGKTTLDLQPVNLGQIIDELVEGHLDSLVGRENKDINILTQIPDDLPLALADPERVVQILTNMADNAVYYTFHEGEITISARVRGSFISVTVTDTGIGISKENQSKIFERFFRVEDSDVQQVSGTGLGLAIVLSLIEMHGGSIEVVSELGMGSSFTFTLPIYNEK